jgi:very-short-patch-repair endonuclease
MASLAAALKRAIQLVYQLEEQELAVEPLPNSDARRLLLFFESGEGGAGVLRRLVHDPYAVAHVAQKALEVCHFDPSSGNDLRKAPGARENCEAACYDCLMNYANQPDHRLLDRMAIKESLMNLGRATVESSPSPLSREDHLGRLLQQCQTETERRFLRFLDSFALELPTGAQVYVERSRARPDFLYDDNQVAVFVDGPVHDYEDVSMRDHNASERLEDAGYSTIRFTKDESKWLEVVIEWPSIFGRPSS